ncbi:hypothetical protein DH09_09605 [Bacillaceae bacterium JMAK1]|nr:hypothetical protein DH09_09605 [Bacillaceae bacterium JMAK1]
MLTEHVHIMSLLGTAEEIVGRKKFQKVVYIGKQLGMPFHEKYGFHMYGPYSEELTIRLDELKQFGFIRETHEECSGYSQYRYELAESGREYLTKTTRSWTCHDEKVVVDELNACTSKFLELMATILYLQPASKEEVIERVATLKKTQNYSLADIDEAYALIDHWKQSIAKATLTH